MVARASVAVLAAIAVLGAGGCGSAAAPPRPAAPASLPVDSVILDAVDWAFDTSTHECDPRVDEHEQYDAVGGCVIRGDYTDLPEHTGSVIVMMFTPADDLTLDKESPATDWLYWPNPLFGQRLTSCREWETLDFPGPAQAIGCQRPTYPDAAWAEMRVAASAGNVLVFVEARAEVSPPPVARGAAGYVRELGLEAARRVLSEVTH